MTQLLKKVVWLEIIENLCCVFPEGLSNQEKEMLNKSREVIWTRRKFAIEGGSKKEHVIINSLYGNITVQEGNNLFFLSLPFHS